MASKWSPRLTLIVVASLFILPLVLAWLMITGVVSLQPSAHRNFGQLVEPPVPIPWDSVREAGTGEFPARDIPGHWLILHAVPQPCDESCLGAVTGLRQVHKALGRHQPRVRVLLLNDLQEVDSLRDLYPLFVVIEDPQNALRASLKTIATGLQPEPNVPGATFVVDPLGKVMMYYPPGADPNELRKDLQRLLTWSKSDEGPGAGP